MSKGLAAFSVLCSFLLPLLGGAIFWSPSFGFAAGLVCAGITGVAVLGYPKTRYVTPSTRVFLSFAAALVYLVVGLLVMPTAKGTGSLCLILAALWSGLGIFASVYPPYRRGNC